jgi:hypothetical protein
LYFDGQPEQPDFTHAWFPAPVFDAVHHAGNTAAARSGQGAMLLRCSGSLQMVQDGPTTGCELRLEGRRGWWLLRLGQAAALDGFVARFAGLTLTGDDPRAILTVEDPEYGLVTFHPDGTVEAEGRRLSPKDWTVAGTAIQHAAREAVRI